MFNPLIPTDPIEFLWYGFELGRTQAHPIIYFLQVIIILDLIPFLCTQVSRVAIGYFVVISQEFGCHADIADVGSCSWYYGNAD